VSSRSLVAGRKLGLESTVVDRLAPQTWTAVTDSGKWQAPSRLSSPRVIWLTAVELQLGGLDGAVVERRAERVAVCRAEQQVDTLLGKAGGHHPGDLPRPDVPGRRPGGRPSRRARPPPHLR
jgi:hypothetical protein